MDAAQGRAGHRQLRLAEGARDAEIRDLDPAAAGQQHVGRLDIAVDDAARMRCVQRFVDLLGDARGRHRLERPALLDDRGQVAAVDELHDDERVAGFHAVVENVDHVGVVERRGRLRLLTEARHEGRIATVLGAQHLDRDVAAQLRIVSAEDGRHPALAKQLDEAIAAGQDLSYFSQDSSSALHASSVRSAAFRDMRACICSSSGRARTGSAGTPRQCRVVRAQARH